MLPDRVHHYVLHGLTGTPEVIDRLLRDAGPEDFDRRPDPERFTLREVIAHLADWEGVWLERMRRIVAEDRPHLPGYDEGQWAIDHDYGHSIVSEQRARFRASREEMIRFLRGLAPGDWQREGVHGEIGPLSVESLAVLVLGHDGYHTHQIAEWLDTGGHS